MFLLFTPKAKLCFLRGSCLPSSSWVVPDDPLRAYSVAATNVGAPPLPAKSTVRLPGLRHAYAGTVLGAERWSWSMYTSCCVGWGGDGETWVQALGAAFPTQLHTPGVIVVQVCPYMSLKYWCLYIYTEISQGELQPPKL